MMASATHAHFSSRISAPNWPSSASCRAQPRHTAESRFAKINAAFAGGLALAHTPAGFGGCVSGERLMLSHHHSG